MNLVVKCRSCGKVLGMAENIPRDQLTVQNAVGEAMLRYRCSDPSHVVNANLNFEWAEQIAKPLAWADAQTIPTTPATNGQAAPAAPAPAPTTEKGTTIVNGKKVAVAADGSPILNDPDSEEAKVAAEILAGMGGSAPS